MFKIIKTFFNTIKDIFNVLGFGFIALIITTSIIAVVGSTTWVILWSKINFKSSIPHDLLLIMFGFLITFILILIIGYTIKSTCKEWWSSTIAIKHTIWDNFSGETANCLAKIINFLKNKKGFD